jgi:uncharacterized membrane protein YkoI
MGEAMQRTTKGLIAVAALCVVTAAGVGMVAATDRRDDDRTERAINGSALERASAAALSHLGGGRVTDTEVGDEESYYEVEVTLADGRQVDVQLDEDFNVVSADDDAEAPEDD